MKHKVTLSVVALFFLFCADQKSAQGAPAPRSATVPISQPARADCDKPTSNSVTSFTAKTCNGRPGSQFDATQAIGQTVAEGMIACGSLEDSWRTYCACMKQELAVTRPEKARDIWFRIINCSKKPNMQVYCGTFECVDPQPTKRTSR